MYLHSITFTRHLTNRIVSLMFLLLFLVGAISGRALAADKSEAASYIRSLEDGSLLDNTIEIYDEAGVAHLPAMAVPPSTALSEESLAALDIQKAYYEEWRQVRDQRCPQKLSQVKRHQLPAVRQCRAAAFKQTRWYKDTMARHKVDIKEKTLGGIVTDVYTPQAGIAKKNRHRVLMHLHGGAQTHGNRWGGYLAATPIADVGKIKVVSVDFRQWPEATHPAAVEDAVAVYKALQKDYRPENIGIYGCSSGGLFTAQTIPLIQKMGLPNPGAIGIFGVGITPGGSDSGFPGAAFAGLAVPTIKQFNHSIAHPGQYYTGADRRDPYVLPGASSEILSQFPPSLFLSSTRDYNLSGAAFGHSLLVKSGIESDLHVWEGLGHCFFSGNPHLPETQDANTVITGFFDKHLGTAANE